MIKNTKLLALSLSSLFILTACGGGGGGSSNDGLAVPQPTKPDNLKIDGGFVNIKDGKENTKRKYVSSDNFDYLLVDGKKLLFTIGFTNKPDEIAVDDHMMYRNSATYARYGISAVNPEWFPVEDYDKATDIIFYYQGKATPENAVPKTGSITYKSGTERSGWINNTDVLQGFNGGVVYLDKDKKQYTAQMIVTANFDKKELTGEIGYYEDSYKGREAKAKYGQIPVYAKINGNKFAGTKNNVTTEGKFFGPNADTVAGTFKDKGKQLTGSFAATKDDK